MANCLVERDARCIGRVGFADQCRLADDDRNRASGIAALSATSSGGGLAATWGDAKIRKVLHSRLPERFEHRVAPVLVELAVALTASVVALLAWLPLQPLLDSRGPYATLFLAVVLSTVVAGWRAGLIALVVGQAMAWALVIHEPLLRGELDPQTLGSFIFVTIVEFLLLTIIALYQREVSRAMAHQDHQMNLLSDALQEIDHRTRNNYQTVVALILLQAQRAENPEVRKALAEAADRVRAVSLASDQLALRSENLGTVRLGDHLRELCEQLKRGLTGNDVLLRCDFADVTARADTAIHLSIIVNELVTNALKHAFKGAPGEIRISCSPAGEGLELVVADNGTGMKPGRSDHEGLGTRLVERFVRELGARDEVTSGEVGGTTHRILVHSLT